MRNHQPIKRLSLLLLLLLTSLRLVACAEGVVLGPGADAAKKSFVATPHGPREEAWMVFEDNSAEENEDESDEGLHFTILPVLTDRFFASSLAFQQLSTPPVTAAIGLPRSLFVLFQNFRI